MGCVGGICFVVYLLRCWWGLLAVVAGFVFVLFWILVSRLCFVIVSRSGFWFYLWCVV